jgi:hypothetical protein
VFMYRFFKRDCFVKSEITNAVLTFRSIKSIKTKVQYCALNLYDSMTRVPGRVGCTCVTAS